MRSDRSSRVEWSLLIRSPAQTPASELASRFVQMDPSSQLMEKGENDESGEVFDMCGPIHLTCVDWKAAEHRKSIAACLVQGVYVLERDRQVKREGNNALGTAWWENFGFNCLETLEDKADGTLFGAVFEHQKPDQWTPRYVLAFRGTLIARDSGFRDLTLDLKLVFNGVSRNSRCKIGLKTLETLILVAGPTSVWIAGHSLGAAIALQAGKSVAKKGHHIESYLFNPPFASPPLESITIESLKNSIRVANSFITAGLSVIIQCFSFPCRKGGDDPFLVMCPWVPYMFLHPDDPISSEYIGYFEHRQKMEEMGLGSVGKVATQSSVISLVAGAIGRDGEATHLIPSAYLTKNTSNVKGAMEAHALQQWWKQNLNWHYQLHQLKP